MAESNNVKLGAYCSIALHAAVALAAIVAVFVKTVLKTDEQPQPPVVFVMVEPSPQPEPAPAPAPALQETQITQPKIEEIGTRARSRTGTRARSRTTAKARAEAKPNPKTQTAREDFIQGFFEEESRKAQFQAPAPTHDSAKSKGGERKGKFLQHKPNSQHIGVRHNRRRNEKRACRIRAIYPLYGKAQLGSPAGFI